MKIATIVVRTLLGLLFLYTSLSYFFNLSPEPVAVGEFKAFQIGLVASSYLLPLAKTVELLCAISFLSGKYTTLANLVILPVTLNILLINYFMTPEHLPLAIFVFVGNIFLIFSHWDNYKSLFKAD